MDTDFETMTGLPLDEILGDIMQSADDAGIELLIEELTGTSSMIIDRMKMVQLCLTTTVVLSKSPSTSLS